MNSIYMENISKTYGTGENRVRALIEVNLSLNWGDFIGVTGESGSGKSTLLSILGAMNSPNTGTYNVDEIDVFKLTSDKRADFRREYLGFVFQSFYLMPHMSIAENVMLPLVTTQLSNTIKRDMAQQSLEKVGLGNKSHRLPGEISGGEKERAAIARAIVNNPPILLADEPTGNLDSKTSHEIMSLFRGLNKAGMTIIMVSHSRECIHYTERIIHIRDGRIAEEHAALQVPV